VYTYFNEAGRAADCNQQGETNMTDQLEQILQEKINMVAKVLIQQYPEIAKNNPKQIGKMAKEIVFELALKAADIVNEE
jgi:hypothetical protein